MSSRSEKKFVEMMTTNFSFIWFSILFLLQMMSIGISMSNLGETKTIKYNLVDVFLSIIVTALSGLSLLWWN